jgi:hypothetical protein
MNERFKNTIIINLISGPGVGKSTIAAGVFYRLKSLGINAELATEYAKDKVWEDSIAVLENQIYIFGKQHHRLFRLCGKVDVIVTDSPILLSIVYDKSKNEIFKELVLQEFKKFKSMTYFLERVKPYMTKGRTQTEEEAMEVDADVKSMLDSCEVPYSVLNGDEKSVNIIIDQVLEAINRD